MISVRVFRWRYAVYTIALLPLFKSALRKAPAVITVRGDLA